MNMTPHMRRFALAVHITSTCGWLGAIVAFLALVAVFYLMVAKPA